jgi:hypothetical protein
MYVIGEVLQKLVMSGEQEGQSQYIYIYIYIYIYKDFAYTVRDFFSAFYDLKPV